jgi:L-ribulose-5-phosphate 3-epimerase
MISIMQGRLLPPAENRIQCFPRGRWQEEFPRAARAGLEAIEWIYDQYGADLNPIATDEGLGEILQLSERHGVHVRSLCADYFMDWPLLRAKPHELVERVQALVWLLGRCANLGIGRLVLPFVDGSRIDTERELKQVAGLLKGLTPVLEANGVELHLETSLSPARFAYLLSLVAHPMVRVNYDAGNSASLGFAPRSEFAAYGEHVGSVHIKDRVLGGSTVALGQGDTDFEELFTSLAAVRYAGDFVLQVARGDPGTEVDWTIHNRDFVTTQLHTHGWPWT